MLGLRSFRNKSKFGIDPPGGSKISMRLGLQRANSSPDLIVRNDRAVVQTGHTIRH